MSRRCWALIGVSVAVLWASPVDLFAGEALPSADKAKAEKQVQQQGKRSKENDVQSRGLFSKKKKKQASGGAAAHSQPTDRTDPPTGDPGGRPMP